MASASEDETVRVWDLTDIENIKTHQVISVRRPYDGMNLSGVEGLNSSQKEMLKNLGAVVG